MSGPLYTLYKTHPVVGQFIYSEFIVIKSLSIYHHVQKTLKSSLTRRAYQSIFKLTYIYRTNVNDAKNDTVPSIKKNT